MTMNLYRYEDRVYSTVSFGVNGGEEYGVTPVQLSLMEFDVISETPCGYWIIWPMEKYWVSKTAKKRFAYPTKEEALRSFRKRKERQISIYSARLKRAKEALALTVLPV